MPPREEIAPGHLVRCYRHDEVAQVEPAVDNFAEFQEAAERILGAGVPAPISAGETSTGRRNGQARRPRSRS